MKTTKKEFKEQVQKHILESLSEDYGSNPKEQLEAVTKGFQNWYSPYEKMNLNKQEAFTQWLQGLPSELNTEFTYHGINKTLASWFENVGEPYKDRDGDKEAQQYYHLVYREFNTLLKKEGVKLF